MTRPDASLVAQSRAAIAAGSKSFALASRLFDPETCDKATLLYWWCRHCDDVIDGQEDGQGRVQHAGTPAERLAHLRAQTDRALAGERTGEGPFDALAEIARLVHMPGAYPHALLEGFALDVEGVQPETEHDLLTYCWHVAGCVGVMMALVMGVPADNHATLLRANDLGLSFQLNNIARDVHEDWQNGRRYLPTDWLAAEGLTTATYMEPQSRAALHRVVTRLVDLAEQYEDSARHGVPALRWRQAWAVLSAARIYGDIGRKVRNAGPAGIQRRAVTGKGAKAAAVAASLLPAVGRASRWPTAPRPPLWAPAIQPAWPASGPHIREQLAAPDAIPRAS